MFDIGADELLLTAVVAIVVIGPKDLPRAMRTVGRVVAKMRRMSNAFRAGIDNVIREAEIEEMEEQWRKQNAAIMAAHPNTSSGADAGASTDAISADPAAPVAGAASAAASPGALPAPLAEAPPVPPEPTASPAASPASPPQDGR